MSAKPVHGSEREFDLPGSLPPRKAHIGQVNRGAGVRHTIARHQACSTSRVRPGGGPRDHPVDCDQRQERPATAPGGGLVATAERHKTQPQRKRRHQAPPARGKRGPAPVGCSPRGVRKTSVSGRPQSSLANAVGAGQRRRGHETPRSALCWSVNIRKSAAFAERRIQVWRDVTAVGTTAAGVLQLARGGSAWALGPLLQHARPG